MGKPRATGQGGRGGFRQGFVKTVTVFNEQIQPIDNAYGRGKGREFGRWIDHILSADASKNRTMGSVEGSLMEVPCYQIESFFRDEIYVERDLQITSSADSTHFICDEVISREDDYYNYTEIFNATTIVKKNVTDYVGSTNTFAITADGSMAADDNIYLTNVQGDNRIDFATFDVLGAGVIFDSTTTSATANKLNDSGGGFSGVVQVGMIAFNDTDSTETKITAVDSDTVLSVVDDIFANSEDYRIYGTRKDWKFARSISDETTVQNLIDELSFESHSMVVESADEDAGHGKIKIYALDAAISGDTWTKPAFIKGVESVKTSLTPLANIFTSFKLFYYWDYGKQDYEKQIKVDKNGFSSPASTLVIADQLLCKKAEETYRVTKPFNYSSNWIYDDTTAELFLQKKIEWFTKQRLIVDWTTGLSDGSIDYIKYERGDQIKLNYSRAIPTGLNNSSFFMITNKRIMTIQGAPLIQWRLIEMG